MVLVSVVTVYSHLTTHSMKESEALRFRMGINLNIRLESGLPALVPLGCS